MQISAMEKTPFLSNGELKLTVAGTSYEADQLTFMFTLNSPGIARVILTPDEKRGYLDLEKAFNSTEYLAKGTVTWEYEIINGDKKEKGSKEFVGSYVGYSESLMNGYSVFTVWIYSDIVNVGSTTTEFSDMYSTYAAVNNSLIPATSAADIKALVASVITTPFAYDGKDTVKPVSSVSNAINSRILVSLLRTPCGASTVSSLITGLSAGGLTLSPYFSGVQYLPNVPVTSALTGLPNIKTGVIFNTVDHGNSIETALQGIPAVIQKDIRSGFASSAISVSKDTGSSLLEVPGWLYQVGNTAVTMGLKDKKLRVAGYAIDKVNNKEPATSTTTIVTEYRQYLKDTFSFCNRTTLLSANPLIMLASDVNVRPGYQLKYMSPLDTDNSGNKWYVGRIHSVCCTIGSKEPNSLWITLTHSRRNDEQDKVKTSKHPLYQIS